MSLGMPVLAESNNTSSAVEDKIFEPRDSYGEVIGFGDASTIAHASLDDLALPSTMHPMSSCFAPFTPPSSSQDPSHPHFPIDNTQSTAYPNENLSFVNGLAPANDATGNNGSNPPVQEKKRGRRPRPFSIDGFPCTKGLHADEKRISFPAKSLFSPRALSISDLKLDDSVDASIEDTGVTIEKIASFVEKPDPVTKQWTCLYPHCGKKFGRKENVKSHVQTHLGDRQFRCNRCNKRFVRGHDLKRHAKIHTGLKPYPCECGNSFARHDALTRHKQRGMCSGSTVKGEMRKPVRRGRPPKNPRKEDQIPRKAQSTTRTTTREKKGHHGHTDSMCSFSSTTSVTPSQTNHFEAPIALNSYNHSPASMDVSSLYTPPESPERGTSVPAYACSESTGSIAATEPETPTNNGHLLPFSPSLGSAALNTPNISIGAPNMTTGAISDSFFAPHSQLKPAFISSQPMMGVSENHLPTASSDATTATAFPLSSDGSSQINPHLFQDQLTNISGASLASTGDVSAYVDPNMLLTPDSNAFSNIYSDTKAYWIDDSQV